MLDPSGFGDQLFADQFGQSGRPCHLFDGTIGIEPCARGLSDLLTLFVEHWLTVFIDQWDRRDPRVDATAGPYVACGAIQVAMCWHVSVEIIERDAFSVPLVAANFARPLVTARGMSPYLSCHRASWAQVALFIRPRRKLTAAPSPIPLATRRAAKSRILSCKSRPKRMFLPGAPIRHHDGHHRQRHCPCPFFTVIVGIEIKIAGEQRAGIYDELLCTLPCD